MQQVWERELSIGPYPLKKHEESSPSTEIWGKRYTLDGGFAKFITNINDVPTLQPEIMLAVPLSICNNDKHTYTSGRDAHQIATHEVTLQEICKLIDLFVSKGWKMECDLVKLFPVAPYKM